MQMLPRGIPEEQGVSSSALTDFVDAIEIEVEYLHSFMLLRHGVVIAEGWCEPYRADDPHVLFSLSKSFTSTAIGLLEAEGRLSIDERVVRFFPDETPDEPSPNLYAMRLRHLLSMSTGHTNEPFVFVNAGQDQPWVQLFLEAPVEREPGTHWLYNSTATYMLSAVVQKVTGETLTEYLQPRLFTPLGIESPFWQKCPQGIDTGGWGLSLTTEDVAKFGQLYLQKGVWNGERLIPEAWIDMATSIHTDNSENLIPDWTQGYGFQFWRCRHNAYRGDGAFGQYCVVMPEQDAVLVMTGGMDDMQTPLDIVWEYLLPALTNTALPADAQAHATLKNRLAALQLPYARDAATSPMAAKVSERTYTLDANDDQISAIRFDFGEGETTLTLTTPHGDETVRIGHWKWMTSAAHWLPLDGSMRKDPRHIGKQWQIGASGGWRQDHTYVIRAWWIETPFARTIMFHFSDDGVRIEQFGNVGFTSLRAPTISGR